VGKPRTKNQLTTRKVATISEPGRHADGGNLFLNVTPTGTRSWVFIFSRGGRSQELGAGRYPDVSLAVARERADAARKLIADGKDPRPALRPSEIEEVEIPTFGAFADQLIAQLKPGWKNPKHAAQWEMSIGTVPIDFARVKPEHVVETKKHRQALDRLRAKRIDLVNVEDVLAVIAPIWKLKPESGARLRGRIEHILDAARAKGHRNADNPARWRGHLQQLLPRRVRLTRGHHAALSFARLPELLKAIRLQDSTAALALEFAILTAARTGEILGATWAEIDTAESIWIVPADRMKASKEHRVPLPPRCMRILEKVRLLTNGADDEFLFPSPRVDRRTGKAKSLSNAAMMAVLKRAGFADFTVHGFRSSFRDWAGETTNFPREIVETALAHVNPNKVEAAYRRSDALAKRRALMTAWQGFCEPKAGNVVPLAKVVR
jgi:integrase